MATGYLTLFDVSGNGLGMSSAATGITTENRSLTVGSGTLTAATGTFTNVGGTLSTVSQPNVTTLGGVTSLNSITVGSGTLSGLSSVSSTAFVGTLSTASQPNVTTLAGVTTLNNLTIGSGSISGLTTLNKCIGFGGAGASDRCISIAGDLRLAATSNYGAVISSLIGTTSGTAAQCAGLFVYPDYSSNAGTVTAAYGLVIGGGATAGTVTTGYGLHVSNPTFGTTKVCAYFEGNVGIGNASPGEKLQVASGSILGYKSTTNGDVTSANQLLLGENSNNSSYRMRLGYYYQGPPWAGVIQVTDNASGSYLLLNPSGGNVGIGTVTPSDKLHVSVGNVEGIRIESTNCGALKFYTDSGNTDNRNWMIAQNYTAAGDFNIMASSSAGGAPTANTYLYINRTGNVGIGTTAPLCTLAIGAGSLTDANVPVQISAAGGLKYFGVNRTNGNYGALFGWDSSYGVTIRGVSGSDNIAFVVSSTIQAMAIASTTGNVGIASTSTLNNKLEVEGGVRVRGDISTTSSGAGVEISYASSAGLIGVHNRALGTTQKDLTVTCANLFLNVQNSSTYQITATTSGLYPTTDNSISCGKTGNRWTAVWAVNGTIQTSDLATKENITATPLGLEFINKLEPCSFKFKDTEVKVWDGKSVQQEDGTFKDEKVERIILQVHKRRHHGLVAQQVVKVLDDLKISTDDFAGYIDPKMNGEEGPVGLRYDQFIAPLIKAVQELNAKHEAMQLELLELRGRVKL